MTTNYKKLLYVAGPYTRPDPVENTHRALRFASALIDADYPLHPFVPHLTLLWHMVTPRPLEFWYAHDMHTLAACEAVMRLPGASTGADAEMAVAVELGLRIVEFEDMPLQARSHWVLR
jgi:hypothetical protein